LSFFITEDRPDYWH